MMTVKISVPPHIAEYARGKFGDPATGVVRFPPGLDIYVALYDLMAKRPVDSPLDSGNLELCLPDRRDANQAGGKSPEQYNWFSAAAQKHIARRLRVMMLAELHEEIDANKHIKGIRFKDSIFFFMSRYAIESLSEDAFFKDYQRWRYKMARRSRRKGG